MTPSDFLNKEEALELYRQIYLVRQCEERIRKEYHKDHMKTPVHLGIGGEAIPLGVMHALPKGTKAFGTYRNHALFLAMTDDVDGFFGEMYGKVTGCAKGKAGSMHLSAPEKGFISTSAVVATTIPLAVGAAFAGKYKKTNAWAAVFFGDGAVEEGVFWESMNFASLKKLPVVFVCEDNSLAIHTHKKERHGFRSLRDVANAFDCYMMEGDGTDLASVVETTRDIMKQAQQFPKPILLQFKYFRFLEHVGPREDFGAGYREKPSAESLTGRDPLVRYEQWLTKNGFALNDLKTLQKDVLVRIDQAVQKAEEAPFAKPEELYTDVFS